MHTYASSWVKKRAFIEKVNSRCFCLFPTAILVHQNGTPIWRLHTKLNKGAWNISENYSETVGHKDLRLGQIVYIIISLKYNIHFLGFFHWTVSNFFFFCCMTVKTIFYNFSINKLYIRKIWGLTVSSASVAFLEWLPCS